MLVSSVLASSLGGNEGVGAQIMRMSSVDVQLLQD